MNFRNTLEMGNGLLEDTEKEISVYASLVRLVYLKYALL